MGWRASHGARRDTNGPVRIEVQPADELAKPNAEDMDARKAAQAATGRPFKKGNRAAAGRRPKLARLGISAADMDTKDPLLASFLRQAEGYRQRRVSELKISWGFTSVGAMSLMATASLQLAMSRYMFHKGGTGGDMELLKKASSMANDARQNELAAWELCSREASAKTRAAASATPWLAHSEAKVRVEHKSAEPEQEMPWASSEPKKLHIPSLGDSNGQETSGGDIPQGS